MFERFTESARRTLFFARFEVTHLGAIEIEPHHILLGLLRESKGLVPRIFGQSGVPTAELSIEIAERHEFRERIPTSQEVPFSTETTRVLSYASEEADRLTHSYIGTEHLLLGVLREERSMAAELLVQHGLKLDDVRNAIVELMQVTREAANAGHAEELERLEQIRQSVGELARLAPDSVATRTLLQHIEGNLDALIRSFRR